MDPIVTGLETLETVLTDVWSSMGALVTRISTSPLLLIGVAFGFAFPTVKLAKRLMGVRK